MALTGTIKKFYGDFGFIVPDTIGDDVFVHISALRASGLDTLQRGDRVRFDAKPARDGNRPRATNLAVIGDGR